MSVEKRRYFRLEDTMVLAYRPADGRCALPAPPIDSTDPIGSIGEGDERIERLLSELRDSDPKVAELIGLLHRKLERAVIQALTHQGRRERWVFETRQVSISACGLGMLSSETAAPGSEWNLALVLEPGEPLHVGAVTVGVDVRGPGQCYWRLEFTHLSPANRERLISHLVRRQAEQLRDRRYR